MQIEELNNLMCNVHINTSGDCRLELSATRNNQDIKEIPLWLFPPVLWLQLPPVKS